MKRAICPALLGFFCKVQLHTANYLWVLLLICALTTTPQKMPYA
jgi:hypothetical protein